MNEALKAYLLEQLRALLAIDSTTSQYQEMEDYLAAECERLGYAPRRLHKGGLTVDLGGAGNGLVLTAHADDIGYMVRYINPDGSLRVCKVGGLYPFMSNQANVRVYTRDGRVYTGTLRRSKSSLHLIPMDERPAPLDPEKNFFLYLDEAARTAGEVSALGIRCGDIVALDPDTVFTPSGYIKSRFLDDKTSVAVLLAYMRHLKEAGISLTRHVTAHFSFHEEVGHGGGSGIPEDTKDVLAIDIGCCGPEYYSDERKVSIGVMDAAFPYHRGMIDELIAAAEAEGVSYALDMFVPHYGSDANVAVRTGLDIRHGLIGPGVLSTHGYERTHEESLVETFRLLRAYAK